MVFKETSIFTKQIKELVDDEQYRELQKFLLKKPDEGSVLKNSGGIRKMRWALDTHEKSRGFRVIYYWHVHDDIFFMLLAYPKSLQDDLTDAQLDKLKKLVESEFK